MRKLLLLCSCLFTLLASGQLTYPKVQVEYDSIMQYKNLRILPVIKKSEPGEPDDSLQRAGMMIIGLHEALATGKAKVKERGDHMLFDLKTLVVDNLSDKYLILMAGEILMGGRQDRVIAKDMLVPPKTMKFEVPVFCIEDGRWSDKESKFKYHGGADNQLREVIDSTGDQQKIWKFIRRQLKNNNVESETESYVNLISSRKLTDTLNDYFKYFYNRFRTKDSSYIGIICVSGDKVVGSDIFISRNLFYSQLNFLLQGYISEALLNGGPITIPDKQVNKYVDQLFTPRTQEPFVKKRGKLFTDKGKVIHINTY